MPVVYVSGVVIVVALVYLLCRRLFNPQVRYVSLPADYFILLLLLGIVVSGLTMRYTDLHVDVIAIKDYAVGLVTFRPGPPAGANWVFYLHLLLVCTLLAYFPFSKLVHMAGIFLSPTRNLANNSRARRHINPWDYPVKVHTYQEWEEEFREEMKAAGYVLEKD